MRVASAFSQEIFLRRLNETDFRLSKALSQLSNGKRVQFGSDDPVAAHELVLLAEQTDKLARDKIRVGQLSAPLETAEGVLNSLTDLLISAKTQALAAASDPPGDIDAIRTDIQTQRDAFTRLVNSTRVSGKQLFSGSLLDTPPYDDTGAYQGNGNGVNIPLDQGSVQVTFDARTLFGEVGGGGVLDALAQLDSALASGDADAIRAAVAPLDGLIDDNSTNLARVGSDLLQVEESLARIGEKELSITSRTTELGAVDVARAITDVQQLSNQYEATLAAGGRLFGGGTLFDFLG